MVWQEKSHRIIMVTNLIEDGRHKCDQYWPDFDKKEFANVVVEKLEEEQYADFTIRVIKLTKEVRLFVHNNWHFFCVCGGVCMCCKLLIGTFKNSLVDITVISP